MIGSLLIGLLATAPGVEITVWTRAPGDYTSDEDHELRARSTLDVSALRTTVRSLVDVHYGKKVTLRGVDLHDLLEKYRPSPEFDRARLHFGNGVRIPVFLREGTREPSTPLLLATAIREGSRWTSEFPKAVRKDPFYEDARPIHFEGNKVSAEVDESRFTPWRHADTLMGIEYVVGEAFDRQFFVDGQREGTAIFLESCQFCHAVSGIGGHLGWDFVEPVPVFLYRETPTSLYYHVSYRASDATARGLLMPVPRKINMDEAKVLWQWLRDVAGTPRPPYAP